MILKLFPFAKGVLKIDQIQLFKKIRLRHIATTFNNVSMIYTAFNVFFSVAIPLILMPLNQHSHGLKDTLPKRAPLRVELKLFEFRRKHGRNRPRRTSRPRLRESLSILNRLFNWRVAMSIKRVDEAVQWRFKSLSPLHLLTNFMPLILPPKSLVSIRV